LSSLSAYEKHPTVRVSCPPDSAWQGWDAIVARIRGEVSRGAARIALECYPGVYEDEVARVFTEALRPALVVRMGDALKSPAALDAVVERELTDDPVFGRMNGFVIEDFLDPAQLERLRAAYAATSGVKLVIGVGTAQVEPEPDLLLYADMARWEIQLRQRAGRAGNLGADNLSASASAKYKRAFFLDWRVADRIKRSLFDSIDYLLDTNDERVPRMTTGAAFRDALRQTVRRPFRLAPFFDPGPWGGQWMRSRFGLPDGPPNYAWCFDCVPEENSLLLDFGGVRIEAPAIDLVFRHPRELLGEAVHARFGAEFPIRFDLLDTMGGGNLSLQVHPLTEYIYDRFGMAYTQDESYYLLDAAPEACVYLGVRPEVDRAAMLRDLRRAQDGDAPFDAARYVNRWPAKKHDHFLIPGGTVHCSGANSMVLEISATPYIFTFKLWDWARLGLDGKPRPVHLDHGAANIQWDRDRDWVERNLVNRAQEVARGEGWREERTGLHEREFIETRRHWFRAPVEQDASAGVHVLNLVEGAEAVVESPTGAWAPFPVHYAETFLVPAAAGRYAIRPAAGAGQCATVRASVRTNA